ncbi:hypothetical protein O3M35_009344 [Rhynocoris fuscipes]|uniref:Tantalus-like domain-containing protein n=1 Tax=Rhynocoris fuscipes TaxID=488301 RepID=A0AAW1D5B5_9HEMI
MNEILLRRPLMKMEWKCEDECVCGEELSESMLELKSADSVGRVVDSGRIQKRKPLKRRLKGKCPRNVKRQKPSTVLYLRDDSLTSSLERTLQSFELRKGKRRPYRRRRKIKRKNNTRTRKKPMRTESLDETTLIKLLNAIKSMLMRSIKSSKDSRVINKKETKKNENDKKSNMAVESEEI